MATPQNLITNPGFEEGMTNWLPWVADPALGEVTIDPTTAFTGLNSIKVNLQLGGRGGFQGNVSKDVLREGGVCRLRCAYLTDTAFQLIVYVWAIDPATGNPIIPNQYRFYNPASSVWTQPTLFEFTLPTGVDWENFTFLRVVIDKNGPFVGNFDDFELYGDWQLTHNVTIQSAPVSGVPITVDGSSVGNTPITIPLQEGPHSIVVPSEVTA